MASGYFAIRYRGVDDFAWWIENHEALRKSIPVAANTLYTEMSACLAFGLDPEDYFTKPRDTRQLITGFYSAQKALREMIDYDSRTQEASK